MPERVLSPSYARDCVGVRHAPGEDRGFNLGGW